MLYVFSNIKIMEIERCAFWGTPSIHNYNDSEQQENKKMSGKYAELLKGTYYRYLQSDTH